MGRIGKSLNGYFTIPCCSAICVTIGSAIFDFEEAIGAFRDRLSAAEAAAGIIDQIGFTKVEYKRRWFKPNEIVVTCRRPGIFVGRRGTLINHVLKKLKEHPDPAIAGANLRIKGETSLEGFTAFYYGITEIEDI